MEGNGAKVTHIEVNSAQGSSELADLLRGNHSGRQVSIKYLPEVCLAYSGLNLYKAGSILNFAIIVNCINSLSLKRRVV